MDVTETYGYQLGGGPSAMSEGVSNMPLAVTTGGFNINHHAIGWNNPLFWLFVALILIVGYMGFVFDLHFKRIGGAKVSGGK